MTSLGIMLKVEQLDDFKANASTKKKKKAKKKVKAPTIETNIVGYSTEKARPKKDSKDPFMRYKDKGRGYVVTATVTSLLPLCHSCSSLLHCNCTRFGLAVLLSVLAVVVAVLVLFSVVGPLSNGTLDFKKSPP